jgi:hypothetical protein
MSTARDLAQQGLEAHDAGRFEEAVEKLTKAYAIVHVPTLAVSKARALVKLQRFTAASELYLEATQLQKTDQWQTRQHEAQDDARRERSELLPRIPKLNIVVEGANPSEVTVSIDGVQLPSALIGIDAMVDPRELKIVGKLGNQVVEQTVSLREGEHRTLTLRFAAAGSSVPRTPTASTSPPANAATASSSDNHQALFGWAAVGIGSAGIAFGAVSGLIGIGKKPADCQGSRCYQDEQSQVNTANRWLNISAVSFVVGGVAAATGVTLLLTAPKHASQSQVGLWLNPTSAAVYGRFQ